MRHYFVSMLGVLLVPTMAQSMDLQTAMQGARVACDGISGELVDMKRTALGSTVPTSVDTELAKLHQDISELRQQRQNIKPTQVRVADRASFDKDLTDYVTGYVQYMDNQQREKSMQYLRAKKLVARNGGGVTDDALVARVDACVSAVANLARARMTAQIADTATPTELARSQKIISACGAWDMVDLSVIDQRARAAARFDGAQIRVIKRASDTAGNCERGLML